MKRIPFLLFAILLTAHSFGQVGIGTTSPNTTLDVRGSLAVNSRSFSTTSETVQSTDYTLLFTGNSACTLTLPDATACVGRIIHIKNTKTGTVPVLTIATSASQTIDGSSSYILDDPNESVNVVSDGSSWRVMGQSLPPGSVTAWAQGGNTVGSIKKIGTIDNYDLPFITNNTEQMRISNTGNVGIGGSGFDASNPERLLVVADTSVTGTDFQNVINAYGKANSYVQFNITNTSNGGNASTDIVATANNGTEDSNYVDLGINSGNYNNGSSNLLNGRNNAYLYSRGQDFVIGNASTSKSMIFFTGGDAPGNEKFRINSTGFVMTAGVASNIIPAANNTYNLGSSSNRWGTIYSNNSLNTSDARLKTNIRELNYGLSAIMHMRSVKYNWREGDDRETKIGFLAQDLRKIVPEVVVGNEAKENLAVNYIELIPILVNAIKEQQQQIEELNKRIKDLENK
jgi:hypothetical protein